MRYKENFKKGIVRLIISTGISYKKLSELTTISQPTLKKWDDEEGIWTNKSRNPFLMNAGFYAAIDVLCNLVIPKCAERSDFKVETIYNILNLNALKSRYL